MVLDRAPAHVGDAPVTPGTGRLEYLDNLKLLLVVGVIAAHAATHYIGGGGWLDVERKPSDSILFGIVGAIGLLGGLFWIGLFFLIAGYLAPGSLTHHGARRFLRDRTIRLGVPFLTYIVLVMPVLHYIVYVLNYSGSGGPEMPFTWLSHSWWPPDAGVLWFVGDLLLFSAVYTAWWKVWPTRPNPAGSLRLRTLVVLAASIALGSFVVHLTFPLYSYQFLDIHLTEWPQYILLFAFGATAAQRGWLNGLSDRLWHECGWAVIAAAAALPIVGVLGGAMTGQADSFTGGWHWQAFVTAVIEGTLAVGGSLWLLEYFRRHVDRQDSRARSLTRSSYGAYAVHAPLLFFLALALVPFDFADTVNILLLAPASVVASFALAWLLVVRWRLAARIL